MAAQVPDKIVLDGKLMDLYSNPLELYWLKTKKMRPPFVYTSECIRGYVAKWEIRANQLLLREIEGTYNRSFILFYRQAPYTLKKLFPKSKNRPVLAVWFSGKLRIPIARMTMYEDHGYDSRFEKELIMTIHKGEVVKVVTLDFVEKSLVVNSEMHPDLDS
ncbi:MAG TPA: hypothetical protein VGK59_22820 [Ohtaekwangia sp.]